MVPFRSRWQMTLINIASVLKMVNSAALSRPLGFSQVLYPACRGQSGSFSDPRSCDRYIQCISNEAYFFRCYSGFAFDPCQRRCRQKRLSDEEDCPNFSTECNERDQLKFHLRLSFIPPNTQGYIRNQGSNVLQSLREAGPLSSRGGIPNKLSIKFVPRELLENQSNESFKLTSTPGQTTQFCRRLRCSNGGLFLSLSSGDCGCLCPIGYTGHGCEQQNLSLGTRACNCESSGSCVTLFNGETGCVCSQGYFGARCQHNIDNVASRVPGNAQKDRANYIIKNGNKLKEETQNKVNHQVTESNSNITSDNPPSNPDDDQNKNSYQVSNESIGNATNGTETSGGITSRTSLKPELIETNLEKVDVVIERVKSNITTVSLTEYDQSLDNISSNQLTKPAEPTVVEETADITSAITWGTVQQDVEAKTSTKPPEDGEKEFIVEAALNSTTVETITTSSYPPELAQQTTPGKGQEEDTPASNMETTDSTNNTDTEMTSMKSNDGQVTTMTAFSDDSISSTKESTVLGQSNVDDGTRSDHKNK